MKLAVISDLHGNYYALAKVLAFLRSQEIDGIIGLGDFVTDGPFPQRMMRVLREMQEEFPCYLVRGKTGEEYLLEKYPASAELEGRFLDKRTFGLYVSESYRTGSGIFRTSADRRCSGRKINESGRLIPVLFRRKKSHRIPAANLSSRHFVSVTARPENSVGISVCIRSFCCPIWKISMPQSCSAGTATSRSKENMTEKHT